MIIRTVLFGVTTLTLAACSSVSGVSQSTMPADDADSQSSNAPNFIVLIGDDMGVETLSCYPVGTQTATTPTLDNLCANGMRFDNFWSQPVCSPTRATILTGQYGFRNGVGTPATGPSIDYPQPAVPDGSPVEFGGAGNAQRAGNGQRRGNGTRRRNNTQAVTAGRPGIRASAYGLPAALAADESLAYQSAAIGKWHLASSDNGGIENPLLVGFDHYSGSIRGGGVASYFAWSKAVDGELTDGQTGYVTSETVNDALRWMDRRDNSRPWLLWVAFNAPHTPFGKPPPELLSDATNLALKDASQDKNPLLVYHAMIEAMDTEIGRLLDKLTPSERDNTYVVFLGDNGTPGAMVTPPVQRGRAKGTVYQGGVNVPFIVSGPKVRSGVSTKALANSSDLYATILDLAGTKDDPILTATTQDSVSLTPVLSNPELAVRSFAFADVFGMQRNGIVNQRTIRNQRYKLLIDDEANSEALYDLALDPYENNNLLGGELDDAVQANYDELVGRLVVLLSNRAE